MAVRKCIRVHCDEPALDELDRKGEPEALCRGHKLFYFPPCRFCGEPTKTDAQATKEVCGKSKCGAAALREARTADCG